MFGRAGRNLSRALTPGQAVACDFFQNRNACDRGYGAPVLGAPR